MTISIKQRSALFPRFFFERLGREKMTSVLLCQRPPPQCAKTYKNNRGGNLSGCVCSADTEKGSRHLLCLSVRILDRLSLLACVSRFCKKRAQRTLHNLHQIRKSSKRSWLPLAPWTWTSSCRGQGKLEFTWPRNLSTVLTGRTGWSQPVWLLSLGRAPGRMRVPSVV